MSFTKKGLLLYIFIVTIFTSIIILATLYVFHTAENPPTSTSPSACRMSHIISNSSIVIRIRPQGYMNFPYAVCGLGSTIYIFVYTPNP